MEKQRKKPGRPRKRAIGSPVSTYGIVDAPINPDDLIELVYNQPQLIKCIVAIFKEYDSDEITMDFAQEWVTFSGLDHSQLVKIQVTINTRDMNLYYWEPPSDSNGSCAPHDHSGAARDPDQPQRGCIRTADDQEYYRIVIRRDNLNIVAAIIDKTHYKVTLAMRRDNMSSLIIILSNCEYENEDRFDVDVVPRAVSVEEADDPDPADFPLEFTIDSHHFRRKISELKKIATDMVIQKKAIPIQRGALGANESRATSAVAASASQSCVAPGDVQETTCDLEISFGATPRVAYTGIYRVASKIKLRCDLPQDEMFIATMNIARIRPLMAVNIPGGTTFFVGREEPHMVRVGLDTRADGHHAILVQLQTRNAQPDQ